MQTTCFEKQLPMGTFRARMAWALGLSLGLNTTEIVGHPEGSRYVRIGLMSTRKEGCKDQQLTGPTKVHQKAQHKP